MESKSSLPCSQHPIYFPCPEADTEVHSLPFAIFNILFNIIITYTHVFLAVSSLRCSYQNPVCIFLSHVPPVTPTSSVLISLPIICCVMQFMDLFTVHFYLALVTFPLQKPNNFLSTLFSHAVSL